MHIYYYMSKFKKSKIKESDEFEWAKEIVNQTTDVVDYRTVKQGDMVVPGKDWMFSNQNQGSIYGIVDLEEYEGEPQFIDDSTDEEFWQYWVHVNWVNKNGKVIFRNNYRVGPNYYDLKYYVPKPPKRKKGLRESDDLEWVEDVIGQEYLRYEEVLPYLDNDDIILIRGELTDDEGNGMLLLNDDKFKFRKSGYNHLSKKTPITLVWVDEISKRPDGWQEATEGYTDGIPMNDGTYEWDKDLLVKIIHKEEHPF